MCLASQDHRENTDLLVQMERLEKRDLGVMLVQLVCQEYQDPEVCLALQEMLDIRVLRGTREPPEDKDALESLE